MIGLKTMLNGLQVFRLLDEREANLNACIIFMDIGEHPDTTIKDICERLNIHKSTVSRNCAYLSKQFTPRKKGLNLVINKEDPMDRRSKTWRLNKKGEDVLNKMMHGVVVYKQESI